MMTHPLQKYIDDSGESQTSFAKRIGVSRITIHRLVTRKSDISMSLIRDICKATDGTLTPSDFFEVA